MERLEEFLKSHRASFDTEQPSRGLWEGIEARLPSESGSSTAKIRRMSTLRWVAAMAACLVLGLGVGQWIRFDTSGELTLKTSSTQVYGLSAVSEEYAELEHFYAQQIAFQKEQLRAYGALDVLRDIEDLDQQFERLQRDLRRSPEDEVIIRAMIQNYQTRVHLLEKVLHRLDEAYDGRSKTKENETAI